MELILINQTKLKIMLTAPDLLHYELIPDELEHMSCTDRHTRAAFRHIFDDAEAQTGFHTQGERLLVQMFTSKCGGCEIFVTKLGAMLPIQEGDSATAGHDTSLTPGEEALIRQALTCEDEPLQEETSEAGDTMCDIQHDTPAYHEREGLLPQDTALRRIILTVPDMKTLLAVCNRLRAIGYTGHSRAYIDENRTPAAFCLCLEVPDGIFYLLPEAYAFLREYGEVSKHRFSELYLTEYGRVLCADKAVETLGQL